MSQMAKEIEKTEPKIPPVNKPEGKAARACEMIIKSKCSIPAAAQSWGVATKTIIKYAKENNMAIVHQPSDLDEKAKQIVESGAYKGDIPRGLKQRVAYHLSLKYGVSKACRILKVCRRGLYYYCDRYNLPTPERSQDRVR